jgi:hypothetical protein
MIEDTCKQIDMSWDSFPYPENNDPLLLDSRWRSFICVSQRDWFKRGWVVREAAFTQYGLIIWHQSEFSWAKLTRSFMWLSQRSDSTFIGAILPKVSFVCHSEASKNRDTDFAQTLSEEDIWQPQSLLEDMNWAKSLELSDSRGRIHAFMDLSENSERVAPIRPDYNLAPLEVYRLLAIHFVRADHTTHILDYVVHGLDFEDLKIPSWIPRWNLPEWSISTTTLHSSLLLSSRNGYYAEPTIMNYEALSLKGIVIDSVELISDAFNFDSTTLETARELWKTIGHMFEVSPYGPSHILEAFSDAVCQGVCSGAWMNWWRSRAAFMADVQVEHKELVSSQVPYQKHTLSKCGSVMTLLFDRASHTLDGKPFIVTKRGYMGLTPRII